jgi:hypothetical protein
MMQPPLLRTSALVALLALFFIASPLAHAATGTISATDKYAWGNDAGWVNFAPSEATVTVTDAGLSGYAWSSNDGWINLSPTNGGVTNTNGTLGGFAWDTSAGWISFTGVTIDSTGAFHGEATGASGYAINFDCTNCDVQTTWRAISNTEWTSSPGGISFSDSTPPPLPSKRSPILSASSSSDFSGSQRIIPTVGPSRVLGSAPSILRGLPSTSAQTAATRPTASTTRATTSRAHGRRLWQITILGAVAAIVIALFALGL